MIDRATGAWARSMTWGISQGGLVPVHTEDLAFIPTRDRCDLVMPCLVPSLPLYPSQ